MTNIADSSTAELDLKAKIRYETLSTLSANGTSSFLISIINAVIVYITLREVAEEVVLNIWLSAIVLISVLRSVMVAIFYKLDRNGSRYDLWTAVYVIFVCGSGLCWGFLPLWDVFFVAGWTETFIVFVISGMSAGGMVSLYPSLWAAVPYQLCILTPLIYVLSSSGAPAHAAMALLVSMYLFLLLRSTYSLNQSASSTIRLEIENEELFKFLLKARK